MSQNNPHKAKAFPITEPHRCPQDIAMPTIICGQTIKAFIQCKMATIEEKATLTEQPVLDEKGVRIEVAMTDAVCDLQQPMAVPVSQMVNLKTL